MSDVNTSGWKVTGHRILVQVESIERTTQSGIIIQTDTEARREQLGQDAGTVVAIGGTAYSDQSEAWCRVGDFIKFGKYAGQIVNKKETKDGMEYRVINDLDVVLVKGKDHE